MSLLNLSFEIAKSGMNTAKQHLAITQHNINNMGTPGYSRQTGVQITQTPIHSYGVIDGIGNSIMGQGSKIQTIQRARNEFVDAQYRNYLHQANYSYHMSNGYSQIEKILSEPSDASLNKNIGDFWNSLSELGSKPSDMSARTTFVQSALTFTTSLNTMGSKIQELRVQYKQELTSVVDKVNTITGEIYELNKKIADMEGINNPANDLRDHRDLLIDELSKIVDVETFVDSSGGISVLAGGKLLVGVNTRKEISVSEDPATGEYEVLWSEELSTFDMKGGHLKASLDIMNSSLKDFESSLNNMITSIATKFNEEHKKGFDLNGNAGLDFFVSNNGEPLSIHNITINPDIVNNEALLAFSSDPTLTGDNGNLNNLLDIKNQEIISLANGNTMTPDEFYNYTVSKIATTSAGHKTSFENYDQAVNTILNEKLSVSSVDLDEESANIIKFQQIYSSNVKLLKTIDEMLTTLIDLV